MPAFFELMASNDRNICTNVYMRFGPFKNCGEGSDAMNVIPEDVLYRIDAPSLPQSRPT